MNRESGVSPVVAVILLVAVSVILSAVIGAFVYDLGSQLGQGTDVGQSATKLDTSQGSAELQVISLSADKLVVKQNGTIVTNLTRVGEVVELPTTNETVIVLAVTDGQARVVQKYSPSTLGSSTVSSSGTLSWSSAGDWDSSVSESGVAHESVQYTDHSSADVVVKGYSYSNPISESSLNAYLPLQEDSSSTAYDIAGSNNGALFGGVGPSGTGTVASVRSTSAYEFDGSDDFINMSSSSSLDTGSTITATAWIHLNSSQTGSYGAVLRKEQQYYIRGWEDPGKTNDEVGVWIHNGSSWTSARSSGGGQLADETWKMVTLVYDGSTLEFYVNGSRIASTSVSTTIQNTSNNLYIGARANNNNEYITGGVGHVRIYDSALSSSEVQQLYDSIASTSTLTTSTKSYETAKKPDLSNLSYSLNGGAVNVTVVGSPGTASEERQTITLTGASNYDLSWNSSHTDFRINLELSHPNPRKTPSVDAINLTG